MWDLLGRRHQTPVHALLGMDKAHPKIPYASQLFGDTPQETSEKARAMATHGYQAVKFGWGPYGRASVREDRDQVLLPDAPGLGVAPNMEIIRRYHQPVLMEVAGQRLLQTPSEF